MRRRPSMRSARQAMSWLQRGRSHDPRGVAGALTWLDAPFHGESRCGWRWICRRSGGRSSSTRVSRRGRSRWARAGSPWGVRPFRDQAGFLLEDPPCSASPHRPPPIPVKAAKRQANLTQWNVDLTADRRPALPPPSPAETATAFSHTRSTAAPASCQRLACPRDCHEAAPALLLDFLALRPPHERPLQISVRGHPASGVLRALPRPPRRPMPAGSPHLPKPPRPQPRAVRSPRPNRRDRARPGGGAVGVAPDPPAYTSRGAHVGGGPIPAEGFSAT